jgi:hypothetical protein
MCSVQFREHSIWIVVAAVLLWPASTARAAEIRAFHNVNQLPFKQIFSLRSPDNSPLTEAGKWRLNLIGNVSNTYNFTTGRQEMLATDVETFRGRGIFQSRALKSDGISWRLG